MDTSQDLFSTQADATNNKTLSFYLEAEKNNEMLEKIEN